MEIESKVSTEDAKIDVFEEDDDFEEFEIDKEAEEKEDGKDALQHWEVDWDDDDVNVDFSQQLRSELESNNNNNEKK